MIFPHKIILTLHAGAPATIGRPRSVDGFHCEMAKLVNETSAGLGWAFTPWHPGERADVIKPGEALNAAWPINVNGLVFWPAASGTAEVQFARY